MKLIRNSILAMVVVGTTFFIAGCDQSIDLSNSPRAKKPQGPPKVPGPPPGVTASTTGSPTGDTAPVGPK